MGIRWRVNMRERSKRELNLRGELEWRLKVVRVHFESETKGGKTIIILLFFLYYILRIRQKCIYTIKYQGRTSIDWPPGKCASFPSSIKA